MKKLCPTCSKELKQLGSTEYCVTGCLDDDGLMIIRTINFIKHGLATKESMFNLGISKGFPSVVVYLCNNYGMKPTLQHINFALGKKSIRYC